LVEKSHSTVCTSFGAITVPIRFGRCELVPLDLNRDINDTELPQRLKMAIHQMEPKDAPWYPGLVDEISAIISVITGRAIQTTDDLVMDIGGEEKVLGTSRRSCRYHPNLTSPCLDTNLQEKSDLFHTALTSAKSQSDVKKLDAIVKAAKLYRDSLVLGRVDEDAAFVLLVAAGECLAQEFTNESAKFEDHHMVPALDQLFSDYGLNAEFRNDFANLFFKPEHVRAQARFVTLFLKYLNNEFFENPPPVISPQGSYDGKTDRVDVKGWTTSPAPWFGKKSDLKKYLQEIYKSRSGFVHGGNDWPQYSKLTPVHDIITPLETDGQGNIVRNPDGSPKHKKPIPSYFWMERAVNAVICRIISDRTIW
jgi:hypothetical protein